MKSSNFFYNIYKEKIYDKSNPKHQHGENLLVESL